MPSILVQFDEATLQALDRIAPVAKRERAEFIRQAVKEAIRKQEFAQIAKGTVDSRTLLAKQTIGQQQKSSRSEAV
jgi:metal-responsive CopG/Arc/MetJ family transcriptional regulator